MTTATDLYALGLLLQTLLTGIHAIGTERGSTAERMQALLEGAPSRPSNAALRSGVEPARARGEASPRHLSKRLRGDLDHIVARSLKKDPGERYHTAEAFAEDIVRHLNGEPVSVRCKRLGAPSCLARVH